MRTSIRSLGLIGLVIACVVAFGWASPIATLIQLLGTTALIMGGTQHPLIDPTDRLPDVNGLPNYGFAEAGLAGGDGSSAGYVAAAVNTYLRAAGPAGESYNAMAVWTPAAFWPVSGTQTFDASVRAGRANLDQCVRGNACIAHVYPDGQGGTTDLFSVFAYSQSARIASLEKAALIAEYDPDDPATIHHVSFVMIGNPNRPDGGILQRLAGLYIPILDVTFDGSSPTDGPVVDGSYLYPTVDIARQYDGWADFPKYPLNLLADLNALAGIAYLHSDYFVGTAANPVAGQPYMYQGQVGDTNYYMIPTKRLPILLPFAALGVPDPILTALDAPLRVLIEWGYDRDTSPGVPSTAGLFRTANPIADIAHLAVATLTGLDDAISEIAGYADMRPFHTTPVHSTFGVGGKDLPEVSEPVAPTKPTEKPSASPNLVSAREGFSALAGCAGCEVSDAAGDPGVPGDPDVSGDPGVPGDPDISGNTDASDPPGKPGFGGKEGRAGHGERFKPRTRQPSLPPSVDPAGDETPSSSTSGDSTQPDQKDTGKMPRHRLNRERPRIAGAGPGGQSSATTPGFSRSPHRMKPHRMGKHVDVKADSAPDPEKTAVSGH